MKKGLTSVSTILLLAALAPAVHAADGTINFNGDISSETCTISAANGTNDGTVILPVVSASSLASPGATAGATQFAITLIGCPLTFNKAAAWFEAGTNVDAASGRLINTGTAKNVDIALYNMDANTPINIGQGSGFGSSGASFDIINNKAILNYRASYYAKAAVTAGDVIATVNYTVQYQ
ncbi:fimbrial protein [Aquitalea denitrificans]|uniref:fimbrial protein n=1 Tax=Aquitalea denitrificans TaxID=519081 RepID=UPI001359EEF7|nr:fimbrial protein [Aquitalea denitrificans]